VTASSSAAWCSQVLYAPIGFDSAAHGVDPAATCATVVIRAARNGHCFFSKLPVSSSSAAATTAEGGFEQGRSHKMEAQPPKQRISSSGQEAARVERTEAVMQLLL